MAYESIAIGTVTYNSQTSFPEAFDVVCPYGEPLIVTTIYSTTEINTPTYNGVPMILVSESKRLSYTFSFVNIYHNDTTQPLTGGTAYSLAYTVSLNQLAKSITVTYTGVDQFNPIDTSWGLDDWDGSEGYWYFNPISNINIDFSTTINNCWVIGAFSCDVGSGITDRYVSWNNGTNTIVEGQQTACAYLDTGGPVSLGSITLNVLPGITGQTDGYVLYALAAIRPSNSSVTPTPSATPYPYSTPTPSLTPAPSGGGIWPPWEGWPIPLPTWPILPSTTPSPTPSNTPWLIHNTFLEYVTDDVILRSEKVLLNNNLPSSTPSLTPSISLTPTPSPSMIVPVWVGLLSYWRFNENGGTTASDSKGRLTGTLQNSPSWITSGKTGSAISFPSVSSQTYCVNMGQQLNVDIYNAFSISMWVRKTSTSTGVLLSKMNSSSPYNGYAIYGPYNNPVSFQLRNTAFTNEIVVVGSSPLVSTSWKHVVITYDGSATAAGVNIYVNGSKDTLTITTDNLSASISNSGDFKIGNFINTAAGASIDEVGFWSRELSQSDVDTLYNSGSGLFY